MRCQTHDIMFTRTLTCMQKIFYPSPRVSFVCRFVCFLGSAQSLEGIGGLVATVHFTRPTPENFSSPVATMVQKLCTSQNLPRVFSGNRSTFSPRAPSGKKATLSPRQKSPFSPGGKKMLLLPSITAKVSTREGSDDASPTPTVAEAWAADNEKQCVFFTRQGAKVVPTTLSADSF